RHLSPPLAAGGSDSNRVEHFFRGVRGGDARLARAFSRAAAAGPHGCATPARAQRFFISDDWQRVAAAGFGGGRLRPATDVLGARDEFHGRNVWPVAGRIRDLVAARIPAGRTGGAFVSGRSRLWRRDGGELGDGG